MKILIYSNDLFIVNYLNLYYSNYTIDKLCDDSVINSYDIIIFDCIEKDKLLNFVSKINFDNFDRMVINITNTECNINNIINIYLPFKINSLKEKIDNFINYYSKNIITMFDGKLNINKNTFIKNNIIIQFTTKERELIYYLYEHKNSTKEELLKNIWETKVIDNKVVETTVYNIKQKLEKENISCFIKNNNGYYQLGI